MRLLINASTLKGTGVTQVAVSFINECANIEGNEYIVFLSPNVSLNIKKEDYPPCFHFYEFGNRSLYGLLGKIDVYRMKKLETLLKPDVVFSVFGPSLWRPRAPHLMGYAYPHYVYEELPIFKHLSVKDKLEIKLRKILHMGYLKRDGDFFVCETNDVTDRLHDIYNIKRENIFTVSNTVNSYFLNYISQSSSNCDDKPFKFYSLCSPMPHKNLAILNEVIPLLKGRTKKDVEFYVTISDDAYKSLFKEKVHKYIHNVGPLRVADCPSFVDSCDALFLPTLLECFSASYPEAMIMRKPILTSNLPFATTVCGDAALYFDPYSPDSIADKIVEIVNSSQQYYRMQEKGIERFSLFPSPKERAEKYLKICREISSITK